MNPQIFHTKLERILTGQHPRVLDLFAGCGGISLGFQRAGFKIAAAVEIDPEAAASHALNFHSSSGDEVRRLHAQPCDITTTEPEDLAARLSLGEAQTAVDVVVGGPPCQAFARVGRAKLREVAMHPEAFVRDPRGNLYLRYLHYVKAFSPLAVLMENVPDVLNYSGHNIAEEVAEVLNDLGYDCRYTLLNAVHYGVPQMRERMFLVGIAKELKADQFFPFPTHRHQLPKGYEGSRQVALKPLGGTQLSLLKEGMAFVLPPSPRRNLPKAVTAKQALQDLPPITLHIEGRLKRGARRFNELTPYSPNNKLSDYGRLMRGWPGFENTEGIYDHVIRYLPRDYAIFERMRPGDQYPEAWQVAAALFEEKLAELRSRTGRTVPPDSTEYRELWDETVPPYDPGKFPNKWRKMEADAPARTLMAHLGKDSYSHIHYDSSQKRTISVREAARLQSFPDGFKFSGTMNPAFRQIGNSVPPLMAGALAATIMNSITRGNLCKS